MGLPQRPCPAPVGGTERPAPALLLSPRPLPATLQLLLRSPSCPSPSRPLRRLSLCRRSRVAPPPDPPGAGAMPGPWVGGAHPGGSEASGPWLCPRQASWATGTGSSSLCDPEGVPRTSSFICPRGDAPAGDHHGSPSRLFLSHPIVAWGPRVWAPLLIPARPCAASPGEPLGTDYVPCPNPRETPDPMAPTRSRFYAQAPASVLGLPGHPAPAGP